MIKGRGRSVIFKLSLHSIIWLRLAGNLVEESSRLGDDSSGRAGPDDETDDYLEDGARTETDEPGSYLGKKHVWCYMLLI